jgi:hypothetical protein
VRWVDQWRTASSLTTQPTSDAAAQDTVAITLRSGQTITLALTQRTPDLVLVRLDEGLAYHLPGKLGETMLRPPNAPPAAATGTP